MTKRLNPTLGAVAVAAALAALAGAASAQPSSSKGLPGYAVSSDGNVVLSGFGACVRSGHWEPRHAAEPCDRITVAQVQAPPAPVAAPAPTPAPAPLAAAAPAPEPPRPVIQKLTLSTDVLFDFNKAELKDSGKKKLDELIAQVKDADVDEVIAIGHADRIASDDYNQKLSEARAQAVKAYLEEQRVKGQRVTAEGKGESRPVTGDECNKMGPERSSNKKLVACLQPDRRVEIEVLGSRQVAGGSPAAGSGATTPPAGSGSTSTTR
jgi:OOP family OmpA-OmpF porin